MFDTASSKALNSLKLKLDEMSEQAHILAYDAMARNISGVDFRDQWRLAPSLFACRKSCTHLNACSIHNLNNGNFFLVTASPTSSTQFRLSYSNGTIGKCEKQPRYSLSFNSGHSEAASLFAPDFPTNSVYMDEFSVCDTSWHTYFLNITLLKRALCKPFISIFASTSVIMSAVGLEMGGVYTLTSATLESVSKLLNTTAGHLSQHSRMIILGEDGYLVAADRGRVDARVKSVYTDNRRLWSDSDDSVIVASGRAIVNKYGSVFSPKIQNNSFIRMEWSGEPYFVGISEVFNGFYTPVRAIMAVPVNDVFSNIEGKSHAVMILSVAVILVTILFAGLVALVLGIPIGKLELKLMTERMLFATSSENMRAIIKREEEANKQKDVFLSTMSHELRTPLNGIIGMVDLLMVDTSPSEKQLEYLNVIQACGNAELNLLSQVLDFAKIDNGDVTIEETECKIRPLINEVVNVAAATALARSKTMTVGCIVCDNVPDVIRIDKNRIRQILLNYSTNAVKYGINNGYILVVVTFIESDDGLRLRFIVKDNGPGLNPDVAKRLFQRFEQGNASIESRSGGTGLGLAICHKLADAMAGEVGVDSIEGKGSEFWIEIPTLIDIDTVKINKDENGSGSGKKNTNSVMVVSGDSEEGPGVSNLLQLILQGNGINVVLCKDWKDVAAVAGGSGSGSTTLVKHSSDYADLWLSSTLLSSSKGAGSSYFVQPSPGCSDSLPPMKVTDETGRIHTISTVIWAMNSLVTTGTSMFLRESEGTHTHDNTRVGLGTHAVQNLRDSLTDEQNDAMCPFIVLAYSTSTPPLSSSSSDLPWPNHVVKVPLQVDSIRNVLESIVKREGEGEVSVDTPLPSPPSLTSTLTQSLSKSPSASTVSSSCSTTTATESDSALQRMKSLLADKKCLVVDDNHVNRSVAAGLMKKTGAKVTTAANGKIAVDKVRASIDAGEGEIPDVILMDVQMPVMNGMDATREIKKLLSEKGIPQDRICIVGLTALAFESDREKCFECGMIAWLSKPFTLAELEIELKKAVGEKGKNTPYTAH